jgi:AraC-like DNA-binding protein
MWQRAPGIGEAFGLGRDGVPPGPLGQFDTDWVPPAQRAEYYRAMLGGLVCAATPHLPGAGETAAPLRVQARNGRLGDLLYVRYGATPHRIERGRADVRAAQTGCYYVLRQLGGPPIGVETGGQMLRLEPGDCLLGDADEPLLLHEGGRLSFGLYLAPRPLVDPWTAQAATRLRAGVQVGAATAAATLLNSVLASTPMAAGQAPPSTALSLGSVVGRLIAVALDEAAPRAPRVRDAVRAARQAQILAHLESHFADPALSPADVAASLGVSVRSLHAALEPTGRSFSEHLTALRLAAAHRLLAADGLRSVADIAFGCGFNDLSTFYRAFRRHYDVTPGDVRAENRSWLE